jgi:UDP-arabinose 4-epimerase
VQGGTTDPEHPRSGRTPVLVTGGAGYIGSHVCAELAAAGYLPVTLDDLSTGHPEDVRWGPLEIGDVGEPADVERVLGTHRPAAVIHLAARAYVGESVVRPSEYYRTNVVGTLCLLDGMLEHGAPPVVFSSTCATYGVPDRVPIVETTPQRPINPYGATKLVVERILADYDRAYELRSVALRYFNAAGADPEGRLGERHDPETHLIPRVLAAAAGELDVVEVYGVDHDTPDGTCVRDYIHVSDLADAHVRAVRWLLDGGASLRCNLGTGVGASVAEVLATAERVVGHPIPQRQAPPREGDPPVLVAAADLARELLGWRPRRSGIEQLVADAWAFRHRDDRTTAGPDHLGRPAVTPEPRQPPPAVG